MEFIRSFGKQVDTFDTATGGAISYEAHFKEVIPLKQRYTMIAFGICSSASTLTMVPEWVEGFYIGLIQARISERTAESFKVIGEVSHAFKV